MRAVPSLIVETPEGIVLRRELAGAGSRAAAGALDLTLVLSASLAVLLVAALVAYSGLGFIEDVSGFVLGLVGGGLTVVLVLYQALFSIAWNGQTPGKRFMGLRVASADGDPAGALQHLLRSLVWPIDAFLLVPAPLGLILMAALPRCQRLGDLAASSVVLREEPRAVRPEPWPGEDWSRRSPRRLELTPGMAARIDDDDLQLLRDVVTRRDMPAREQREIYDEVVEHYAARLGFKPAQDARTTLKELYLFARESRRERG